MTSAPSTLVLLVREFINRLGPEVALARFQEGGSLGPGRPLNLERVCAVAAGEAEPTFRMAAVAYEAAALQQSSLAPQIVPPVADPSSVQPWALPAPTFEPIPVQPWMR